MNTRHLFEGNKYTTYEWYLMENDREDEINILYCGFCTRRHDSGFLGDKPNNYDELKAAAYANGWRDCGAYWACPECYRES